MKEVDGRIGAEPEGCPLIGPYPGDLRERALDFFADLLCAAGREFGGDIRAAAVLFILAQGEIRARRNAEDARLPQEDARLECFGMTQTELSTITGIPRETVRRKLMAMERLGWLARRETVWYLACDNHGIDDGWPLRNFGKELSERAREFLEEAAADTF